MSSKYNLLTEAEKKRIICIWLNSEAVHIDWERAISDFGGNGNVESFKRAVRATIQKVNEAPEAKLSPGPGVVKRKANGKASKSKRARKTKQKQEAESDEDREATFCEQDFD